MIGRERLSGGARAAGLFLLTAGLLAGLPTAARAGVIDAAQDFVPTYLGPRGGDLDVLFAEVLFDGNNFTLRTVVNAPVGTTAGAFYVWGFNRGRNTQGFPVIAPGVLFDTVVVVRPTGVNGGTVVINGNEITAILPRTVAALAPLPGLFTQEQYTFNLWPRSAPIPGNPDGNLSDFAPDNSNAAVTVLPEPSGLVLLLGAGLTVPAFCLRRRRG